MYADVSNIKINLTLDILSLRDDGYHEIDSVFSEVGYGDNVVFDAEMSNPLELTGFNVPSDSSNLVWKAHDLFCEFFGIEKRGGFKLDKRVPPGSGFGSGSSNAWSVFKILSHYYEVGIDEEKAKEMSMMLGSDIFYFSKGGFCRVKGVGDLVEKIEIKNNNLSVVFGTIDDSVLTKEAYSWWDSASVESGKNTESFLKDFSFGNLDFSSMKNDLERVILPKRKKMNSFLASHRKDGGFVSMTGSGNGIFTICKNNDEVDDSMKAFKRFCDYGPKVGKLIA